jgi:hypothetical protein
MFGRHTAGAGFIIVSSAYIVLEKYDFWFMLLVEMIN